VNRARWSLLLLVAGCLDYPSFLQKQRDRYCEELEKCSPDTECVVPTVDDTGYTTGIEDCDFDRKQARDCLEGEWKCESPLGDPAYQYPIGPAACSAVCRSAFTTTTTSGTTDE